MCFCFNREDGQLSLCSDDLIQELQAMCSSRSEPDISKVRVRREQGCAPDTQSIAGSGGLVSLDIDL